MPCCARSSSRRLVRKELLPWIGFAIRLLAAAIWLVAGVAKLADLDSFRVEVGAYDILPANLVDPVAYALPFVEIVIGLYLAGGLFVRQAAAVGTGLMMIFLAAQAQAWARGISLECGCFGGLTKETVGLGSILRDVALALPNVILLIRPARHLSLDKRFLHQVDRFAVQAP